MADNSRTTVTFAIDVYSAEGTLHTCLLVARTLQGTHDPHDVADRLVGLLPAEWRQLTYLELEELLARANDGTSVTWSQLSLF